MRVLLISNGSGEDRIAAQLATVWRRCQPELELQALALVGSGLFYQQAEVHLLPPRFNPPSQGFAYLHPGLLLKDFQAGLSRHLQQSLCCLRALRGQVDGVLAVGDIVAVFAACQVGAPVAFFGAAFSDHYLGPAGLKGRSSYDPLQRHLLRQALVFARDPLTAANLRRYGLDAHFEGNPMLDCVGQPPQPYPLAHQGRSLLALLPGSHADAPGNFGLILQQLEASLSRPLDLLVLCAPQLTAQQLLQTLRTAGWHEASGPQASSVSGCWQQQQSRLWLLDHSWLGEVLQRAELAIGLAGTANEQCVGSGLPVISFATPGSQYSWAFGEAQQRLLGSGLSFLGDPHPLILDRQLAMMLSNPDYRRAAQAVAAERFGAPGGDQRLISRVRGWLRAGQNWDRSQP